MPPSPTPRQVPSGFKLKEGFKSLITFAAKPAIQLWEIGVQPPGFDGGSPIKTTTQHNVKYHTKAPPTLVDLTDGSGKCAYDPDVLSDIILAINREDTITYLYSDGTTIAVYGYLKDFKPESMDIEKRPEASFGIVHTNADPATGVEAGPVLTKAAGT